MRTANPPVDAVVSAPPEKRRGRLRLTPRGAILVLITAALLLYMVVPVRTYLQQRDRVDRLLQQSQVLREQNAKLQAEVDKLKDPAYLEQVARACLGMVRPGEISFVVVPKGSSSQAAPGPAPDCG